MHEFWQYLAEQWAHVTQQLTLQWAAIQAQPGSTAGTVASRLLEIGQWLRTDDRGVLLLLLGVVLFTRRFLRKH